jgi:hypothetical protein
VSHVPPIEPSEPSEPARDERPRPRYGEYAAPSPASAESPAPPAAPDHAFAASAHTPSAEVFHNAAPAKAKRLGVVAFVAGLVLLVFALVLSVVTGLAFGPLMVQGISDAGTFDPAGISEDDPAVAAFGVLSTVYFLGATALGLWALVQGIIAIVQKRGRAFGIVAIALAVATPVISFVVFYAVAFASAPEIFSSVG